VETKENPSNHETSRSRKKKKNEKGSLALYVSSTKEWRSKASTA